MAAIFQYFHNDWYSLSLNTRNPNFWGGSVIWKFSIWSILTKMAGIFHFFHNGQHWYSISVDTQKNGDPNFGGVSNLKFFRMIDINKMVAILNFFHNGQHWYSFSLTLGKQETWIFHWFSFLIFSVDSVFPITLPRFCFNINAWLHLKHFCMVTFLHLEDWRCEFSIDSVFQPFLLVQFSLSPFLGSVSALMCGYT